MGSPIAQLHSIPQQTRQTTKIHMAFKGAENGGGKAKTLGVPKAEIFSTVFSCMV